MVVQLSVALRTAMAETIETTIGVSAVLRLRTGPQPATCATADSGTVVISYTFASDWASAAVAGVKTLIASTVTGAATQSGTLGHYRLYAADGTTCHEQGSITVTGGGGDMTFDSIVISSAQTVAVGPWTMTVPNA